MITKDKTNIIIRITTEMKEELAKLAKADRRTLSNYIRVMIEGRINENKFLNK